MLKIVMAAVLFGGAIEIAFLEFAVRLIPSHGIRLGLAFAFAMTASSIASALLNFLGVESDQGKVVAKLEFKPSRDEYYDIEPETLRQTYREPALLELPRNEPATETIWSRICNFFDSLTDLADDFERWLAILFVLAVAFLFASALYYAYPNPPFDKLLITFSR